MAELDQQVIANVIEAALFAAEKPLNLDKLQSLFGEEDAPEKALLRGIIEQLQQQCEGRGVELVEVSSGFRYQTRKSLSPWISKLWEERPPRYSRALLETLALIAYRQPITRAEIEDIRGVAVSSQIIKTLIERNWVRVIGHRDVPGRPGLYASTKEFLDYFGLKSLDDLPALADIKDIDKLNAELDLRFPGETETVKEVVEVDEINIDASEQQELVSEAEMDAEEQHFSELESDDQLNDDQADPPIDDHPETIH